VAVTVALGAGILVPGALASAVDYGPTLPRATSDRPDDSPAQQVHVLYVVPSDRSDRGLDTKGVLTSTVSSFETWLADRTGGRPLRVDTYRNSLDVTFLRLSRTDAQIASYGALARDQIEVETKAAGFADANKVYAVYYDGSNTRGCGGSAWPPERAGNVAVLYLRGLSNTKNSCFTEPFAGPGGAPAFREFAMLQGLLQAIGFVPTCAPHQWRGGHVSDSADDLMWTGDGEWAPHGWARVALDFGHDDYYKHPANGCADLDRSPFLAAPPTVPKEQAELGPVQASLFYDLSKDETPWSFTNLRVRIVRQGALLLDQAVPPYPRNKSYGVVPAGYGDRRSVSVRDLDGDGEPEVVLDLYWGGAHCCFWSRVYRYDAAAGTYRVALHFWGDPTYRVKDLNGDGKPELVTADDRFAYRFAPFAFSGMPVQVWSYAGGVFSDVTRRFPNVIAKDAADQWRFFLRGRKQHVARGFMAGWVADEYALGHRKAADRALARALRRGELKADDPPRDPQVFIRALKRFLRSTGYLR
jgi:hypothetical protein